MRALFVSHSTKMSGANKSFVDLINKLKDKMEIIVLVNGKEGFLNSKLMDMNIPILYLPYAWALTGPKSNIIKSFAYYIKSACCYLRGFANKKIIKSLEKIDFVYSNTSVITIGAVIAKALSVPHFWHIREFGKEDFRLFPIFPGNYYKNFLAQSYRLIVISDTLKKKYVSMGILPENNIRVIYNGFDIDLIKKKKVDHIFGECINILITGQVCKAKGQEQAIRAVAEVIRLGYNVELYIAGNIDKSYITPILKYYHDHEKWLHLLGSVRDIYKLRNKMDIELVCSKCEAFGRVTIEAMCHSIPVIGSKTGGTQELIKDGETGLLYEYNNIKELISCIIRLIEDEELYKSIMRKAFDFASEFTIEKTSSQLMDVFNEMI